MEKSQLFNIKCSNRFTSLFSKDNDDDLSKIATKEIKCTQKKSY